MAIKANPKNSNSHGDTTRDRGEVTTAKPGALRTGKTGAVGMKSNSNDPSALHTKAPKSSRTA